MARPTILAGFALALLAACGESPQQAEERELSSTLAALEARADAIATSSDAAEERVAGLEARTARVMTELVVVLAATAAAAQAVCAGRMSTSQFRARHGITTPDVHVDHMWPRARGGLDHPLNYQPLDAHTNMSCGQGCLGSKFAASPLAFTTGLAVSILGRLGCP